MHISTDIGVQNSAELVIPPNNKQHVYACSLRFGGCGFITYKCNIPSQNIRFSTITRVNEVLCPMCQGLGEYSDMLRLTYENFQPHVHEQNRNYVRALLDASGIKEEWIYRP